MIRTAFLHGAGAVAIGALAPSPAPSPAVDPYDICDASPVLPYDRPLGLRMRVLDGPDFDLIKYRGYAVWINIFATWCPPCNSEQARVVALAEKYYDRGLRVVGLDVGETDDQVRAYRKKYGIRFPIMMDGQGIFGRALEQGGASTQLLFPAHLMFAPNGYLYCYKLGSMGDRELTHKLDGLMKALPTPPPPGPVGTSSPMPTPTTGVKP